MSKPSKAFDRQGLILISVVGFGRSVFAAFFELLVLGLGFGLTTTSFFSFAPGLRSLVVLVTCCGIMGVMLTKTDRLKIPFLHNMTQLLSRHPLNQLLNRTGTARIAYANCC